MAQQDPKDLDAKDSVAEDNAEGVDLAPPLPGGNPGEVKKKRRRTRKRWVFLSIGTALVSFVAAVVMVAIVMVMGRSVALPDWATEEAEARINAQIAGPGLEIAGIRVGLLDDQLRPTVELQGVRMRGSPTAPLMALPSLQVQVDTSELLQGRIALETLRVKDARVNLTRNPDGQFAFAFGSDLTGGGDLAANSVAEAIALVDELFANPALRELEDITVSGVTLTLDDQRAGREFSIQDGQLELINEEKFLALEVAFDLAMDGEAPATLVLSADKAKGAGGGRFEAEFSQLRVRDVAEQVSTLNFLSLLDAPVDGTLTTEFGTEGELVSFSGGLDIGRGFVQPAPQAKALPLNSATTSVRFSSATQRLHLEGLEIDAPELRLSGQGHADLKDFEAGIPETLLMQIRLANILLDPEGIFETPVRFSEGQADLRYRPNDLTADIGQLVLRGADTEIVAGGKVSIDDAGWIASVDAKLGQIAQGDLLSLWPTSAVQNTRDWLTDNVRSGNLKNAAAAIRVRPGAPPDAAVTFDFDNAAVRYMKTLPQVEGGRGYVTIAKNALTLALHEGYVTAPNGEQLDMTGTVMQIPDVDKNIPDAEIALRARGPMTAALALLDEEPFEFLSKSDLSTELADGQADVTANLYLPLAKDLLVEDVRYDVAADLRNLSSTELVPGRVVTSEALSLVAGDGVLAIEGGAALDGVPITVAWQRALGPESPDSSQITGTIELTQAALRTFEIDLPDGSVSGRGQGNFTLSLDKGVPPELELTSNLRGVGLSIEALGWRKTPDQNGSLRLAATLGDQPQVRALEVAGAGLEASGSVTLRPGGGLDRAVFSPLQVSGRLNSRVEVVGRGRGTPVQLLVRGGTVDIRQFGVGSGRNAGQGGPPLDLALDSLIVTDDIRIDNFRGRFRNERGLDGTFTGNINGSAVINGTVVPTERGLAVRVGSADGGGVIRSTGIFRNARGGEMNLVLQPTGRAGEFNGQLSVANTRIKDAPALADLLSALSVIGLLEQLSGDGILFSEVEAYFTLSPGGVRLRESRAVGPSMGITMDGVYSTTQRRMQMQGVVSPLYLVNRPLGFLFSKRGEGLFGFNYTLAGAADAPKVGVNPLSVFTPGRFREIFRRPPPQQPQN